MLKKVGVFGLMVAAVMAVAPSAATAQEWHGRGNRDGYYQGDRERSRGDWERHIREHWEREARERAFRQQAWREHEWREHEWRERERNEQLYRQGYYQPGYYNNPYQQ